MSITFIHIIFKYNYYNNYALNMYIYVTYMTAGNWVDSVQDRDYWRALVNAALNLPVS